MERIEKAAAIAVVLFFVALAIVVGVKMDQNTIALLGGTTLGLLIATPCAAIATYVSMKQRDDESYNRHLRGNQPYAPPPLVEPPPIANHYYGDVHIYVNVPYGASPQQTVEAVARARGVSEDQAKAMIASNLVALLMQPPPRLT